MLYSCKSNLNGYEFGKMAPYFWKRYYIRLVLNSIIINLLISTLVLILCQNLLISICFFAMFLVYSLIYFKVKLSEAVSINMAESIRKGKFNPEMEIKFYSSYLALEQLDKKLKVNYTDFNRVIETDTNFYLQCINNGKKKILIIQKNNCELELIQFIRKIFKNIENHLGGKNTFVEKIKLKNSKWMKIVMLLLLILSILSLPVAFYTVITYSEIHNVQGIDFIQFCWLFWIYLPIPILSIIIGYIYQKKGVNCSKNILIGFIVSILIFIFGLFTFVFPDLPDNQYDDYSVINNYKQIMGVEIPNIGQLKIMTLKSFNVRNISNLTIITVNYEQQDTDVLASEIKNNNNWILSTELPSTLEKLVPTAFASNNNIYYLFYNKTLDEYNTLPLNSVNYEVFTIKYDISKKILIIYSFYYNK